MDKLHPLGSRASRCGGAHPTSARDAMPTSPPGSRCCIIKPLLAVGYGGVGDAVRAPPPCYLSWISWGRRCVPFSAPMPMHYSPHTHRSHPYPLFRCAASALVVVHVSNPYPHFLPRSSSFRCLVVPSGLAHPSPRPSFIPWFHSRTLIGSLLRRPFSYNGIVVVAFLAASVFNTPSTIVVFLAAAWRPAGTSFAIRRLVCLFTYF